MPDDLTPPGAPPTPPDAPAVATADGDGHDPLNIADELKDSYLTYAMSVIISRALPDVRDGLKPSQRRILVAMNDLQPRPQRRPGQVRQDLRRHQRQLPPARRGQRLPDPGPHGPGVEPALRPHRQAGQLRLHRRAAASRDALHRGSLISGGRGDAHGPRPRDRRHDPQLRRPTPGADRPAEQVPQPAGQRLRRHRRRHGHRHPAAQPARGLRRRRAAHRQPAGQRCSTCWKSCRGRTSRPAASSAAGRASSTPTPPAAAGSRSAPAPTSTRKARGRRSSSREVPYQQTRIRLAEAIGELVKDERIKGIHDIKDESSQRTGEPVRLVVYLKQGADPQFVLNQLYALSPLQKTVSMILLALVDGRPRYLLRQGDDRGVPAPPRPGDPPPHRVPAARGQAARPRPRRPAHRHLVAGRGDPRSAARRRAATRPSARLQGMAVGAAVLERALGEDHFAALQREIGVQTAYHMTEAQAEAVVRMQLGQLARAAARRDPQGVQRPAREDHRLRTAAEQRGQHPGRGAERPGRDARTSTATTGGRRSPARSAASTWRT